MTSGLHWLPFRPGVDFNKGSYQQAPVLWRMGGLYSSDRMKEYTSSFTHCDLAEALEKRAQISVQLAHMITLDCGRQFCNKMHPPGVFRLC